MTDRDRPVEVRPQAPQGEEKGLIHDVAAGALGGGVWKGVEVVGGRVIDHLRPGVQSPVPPAPPSEGHGASDSAPDWNWPAG